MARHTRKCDARPSWQFYSDDWLSEACLKLCDLSARGLWIELLCHMFKMEERGKLCINGRIMRSKDIADLVGRPEAEVKQAIDQLQRYGVCESDDDGCIYSRRMVREESIRRSKVEAGRKGGRSKQSSKTEAKGGSSSPTPTPTPTSSPTPTSRKKTKLSAHFEKFWQTYPKKKSKGQAERTFAKINPDEQLLATILAKIEQAKKSTDWQKDNSQYIPYPATWLNAKGWEDEYDTTKDDINISEEMDKLRAKADAQQRS